MTFVTVCIGNVHCCVSETYELFVYITEKHDDLYRESTEFAEQCFHTFPYLKTIFRVANINSMTGL